MNLNELHFQNFGLQKSIHKISFMKQAPGKKCVTDFS